MANLVTSYQDDVEYESVVPAHKPADSFSQVKVDIFTIAAGPKLANELLNADQTAKVLERMNDIRREIAREVGVIFGGVHLRDDMSLDDYAYVICVRDFLVARGTIEQDKVLAIGTQDQLSAFDGELVKEPVYKLDAKWIETELMTSAREAHLKVFDGLSVIASHFGQVVRDHMATVFSLDIYTGLRDHMRQHVPALMEEFEAAIDRRTAHRAYRILLEEMVWPRDPVATLERMLEASDTTKEPVLLAEAARKVLVPAQLLRKQTRKLQIYKIDPELEKRIAAYLKTHDRLADGDIGIQLRKAVAAMHKGTTVRYTVNLLCGNGIRRAVAELFLRSAYSVSVYALDEIPREIVLDQRPLILQNTPVKKSAKVAAVPTEPSATVETEK